MIDDSEADEEPADGEQVDTDADPFERLGPTEREGDPFERLGAGEADEQTADAADPAEDTAEDDPWVPPGTDERDAPDEWRGPTDDTAASAADEEAEAATPTDSTPTDASESGPRSPGDDPFADIDTPGDSPFEGETGGLFERSDVGPADPDEVWESVVSESPADPADVPETDRYSEVSKHRFCEQCEYFSEPPDSSCTHDVAEIIEFLDMETVRVRDCPIVAEKRALEDEI
jgi:hypothetical protein